MALQGCAVATFRVFGAPQTFNEDLHISFAGGEPLFAVLSEELTYETSNAFTASWNHTANYFGGQTSLLAEAFLTQLNNPFINVSTGATLPNGSIVEEVRNGSGAIVQGLNYEVGWAPNPGFVLQLGGTLQRSTYTGIQTLFEPEGEPLPGESIVSTIRFLRTPNTYGYFNMYYAHTPKTSIDFTGTYTGSMLIPLIVSDSGFLRLRESKQFLNVNVKVNHEMDVNKRLLLESSVGIKNLLNSFQDDFQSGAARDAGYIYGPVLPRTFCFSEVHRKALKAHIPLRHRVFVVLFKFNQLLNVTHPYGLNYHTIIIGLLVLLATRAVFTVKQKTAVVIERLGKFQRIAQSGLQFKIPFIDQKSGTVNLRVRELPVNIETKTKDDVFVNLICFCSVLRYRKR